MVSPDPARSTAASRADRPLLQRRFSARLLPQLRLLVEECAAREGLCEPRRGEFVLAVDEIAGNAVEHAGGSGRLVLLRVGDELECRISDAGPGFSEAVIPELLPGLDGAPKGRGLWLARLVADRFAVAPGGAAAEAADGDGAGSVVTVAVRLR
ncbi:ATP-binding protein [Streptomyces sp. NPDC048650]|uniref:ATP-binding protein n=1 Tax=unclassified Streptomyces TaxID=2593676 RepID=UPI00371A4B61